MKFCATGPDIPDDLLWQRDAGNTVFVCGSGVSTARAGLPGFVELASQVMDQLRVPDNHSARDILRISQDPNRSDTVPMDQLFGDLERDYYISEIEDSISNILSPQVCVDTSCHKIISDLAKTPDNKIRLVTTNFDNLFSQELDRNECIWPNLPDSKQAKFLDALVYLHGKCSEISNSSLEKFVISTSSFGKAYLSDRQASEFIQSILNHFTVVFLGYSANDPPMQYLLEALAQSDTKNINAYAFQKGDYDLVYKKWEQKGVKPICFDHYDHLWDTLEAWRHRALNFESWAGSVLKMSQLEPYHLENWQRSQVKHLASHPIGAKLISDSEVPISPHWLFAFDPHFRYATPKNCKIENQNTLFIDPFDHLGFAEDKVPDSISSDDQDPHRGTPDDAWNAFRISSYDVSEMKDEKYYTSFNDLKLPATSRLPRRLEHLAKWISKVAQYPATLRWAIYQDGFHPYVRKVILQSLRSSRKSISSDILHEWETLFESWDRYIYNNDTKLRNLAAQVNQSGWTDTRVSSYKMLMEPKLVVRKGTRAREIFSSNIREHKKAIIKFDVVYHGSPLRFSVSEKWDVKIFRQDRVNLERAIELESQTHNYQYHQLASIIDWPDLLAPKTSRNLGLNQPFFRYISGFQRMLKYLPEQAKAEAQGWPLYDKKVFARLRIWVCGFDDILSAEEAGKLFVALPQDIFWDSYNGNDLLYAICKRWDFFSDRIRRRIGKKIMEGRDVHSHEDEVECMFSKTIYPIRYLEVLEDNQCRFDKEFHRKVNKFKMSRIESDSRVYMDAHGRVMVDLSQANEVDVKHHMSNEKYHFEYTKHISGSKGKDINRKEFEEFLSLCKNDLSIAFRKIYKSARIGDYPEWMWSPWLQPEWNKEKCESFLNRTTILLCIAPIDQLARLRSYIFAWFQDISRHYISSRFELRDELFKNLIHLLKSVPSVDASTAARYPHRAINWVSESLNSPAGMLVYGLHLYPEITSGQNTIVAPRHWLDKASSALLLPGVNGKLALVAFIRKIQVLNHRAPQWTRENVVGMIKHCDPTTTQAYLASVASLPDLCQYRSIFVDVENHIIDALINGTPMRGNDIFSIVGLTFEIWCISSQEKNKVKDKRFHDMLLSNSAKYCVEILPYLSSLLRDDNGRLLPGPFDDVESFFRRVWPLERSVVSPTTNEYLIQIALSNERLFSLLTPMIFPRLSDGLNNFFDLGDLTQIDRKILKSNTEDFLELLSRSLPADSGMWYSEIGETFDEIERNAPALGSDPRLVRLRRSMFA